MQYSIIKLSEIKQNSDCRLDAEYYKLDYQKFREYTKKNNFQKLESYVNYIKRGRQPLYLENGNIPILRSVNIKEKEITHNRQEFTSYDFFNIKKQGQCLFKDILLTSTGIGTLGRCSINLNNNYYFIDSHITILRDLKEILPEFLYVYLNSKYGQMQINFLYRGSSGQIEIYPNDIKNILIKPLNIQTQIANIVNQSHELRQQANNLYQEAENILLEELNIKNYKPNNKKFFIKKLSETQQVERIDAEYFQAKYDDIINIIKNYSGGYNKLENFICKYSTGYAYKSENYLKSGIPLIRISNIGKNILNLNDNPVFISEEYSNISKKDIAKSGNILISMSGTIGNVVEIPDNIEKCCINQRVLSFECKKINSKYLTLFLNSNFGAMQFERIGVGGVQINLSYNDIKNLLVPLLSEDKQQQISNKIQESFEKRNYSDKLIDIAKRAVEIAIEEDEDLATKYIENNSQIYN